MTDDDVGMSFGEVLEAMKADPHRRFARKGWNGRGIFISLQVPDEKSLMTHPYIFIDTTGLRSDNPDAPRDRVPWLASQTDMLSDDWYEVKGWQERDSSWWTWCCWSPCWKSPAEWD